MSPTGGGFCFEQLVELAGFSVAQAITKVYSKDQFPAVAVFSGPGNNGLDGLVAARHLAHFGYRPRIYYPKRPDKPVNKGLMRQCELLDIPFVESPDAGLKDADLVVDAIFGFSFSGEVREPFRGAIGALSKTSLPIVSVDIPSAWDVEKGDIGGNGLLPSMLVSLTAPKEGAQGFQGIHYLGGRFINKHMDEKWGLNLPDFPGTDQCVRLGSAADTQTRASVGNRMDDHFLHNVASQSLF
ncbi:NAD(P)H-hydrate epimerase [Entomortierella parvispora]|uniref:NAD(P)H-hydrate epimerase n=1 Tax=Entomortierella parvispora TaxID=205924 RepID=A0A9P3LV00_9FUNG|nr:NAD(P)H-hydrate epimerase [Entomortierella parvispora]